MKKLFTFGIMLITFSMPISAEVFKCTTDGKIVYQQTPCSGQMNTEQPMKIDTRDTGNGGMRESEVAVLTELTTNLDAIKKQRQDAKNAEVEELRRQESVNIERRKANAMVTMARALWTRRW